MFNFLKSGYEKIKSALSKTRSALSSRIKALFGKPWNDETFDQLEQILFEADLGTKCATSYVDKLRSRLRTSPTNDIEQILKIFHDETLSILSAPSNVEPKAPKQGEPYVVLIVGVNGSGKTTSIAKLAKRFQKDGKKVLLAAGDTFRAAAIDQLAMWADRLKISRFRPLRSCLRRIDCRQGPRLRYRSHRHRRPSPE
jgi:fused signal recognition particle receptor